ncbi:MULTISPECIES: hypothetical protein [unclassified Sedimentibacter]|uniref:hypothetical protein n=1 Tax=unclassified Sedimentibacter TaxID=2649220 RepID=UPI0027DF8891|nr:hypothetical protein [Sedimentibacter sp. MB35-C1]WMJ78682.1 hypothetical protein RBQ61_07080 [Sedimentibacter sp. MB35-C1]
MKKILGAVLIVFMIVGMFTGCGENITIDVPLTSENEENEVSSAIDKISEPVNPEPDNSSKSKSFDKISDFIDAVTEIEGIHEKVINEYENIPVIEIPAAFMPLATASMYELLNMDNKDGRFEGTGMISGFQEFIEKNGRVYSFGRDDVREKDGFTPYDKAGDRLVENGSFDGNKNLFHTESYSERNSALIQKTSVYCLLTNDDTVILLYQFGNNFDSRGEAIKADHAVFLTVSKNHYDFVLAQNTTGADFQVLPFSITTTEEAKKLFMDNGYKIDKTGGIYDGKYEVTTN